MKRAVWMLPAIMESSHGGSNISFFFATLWRWDIDEGKRVSAYESATNSNNILSRMFFRDFFCPLSMFTRHPTKLNIVPRQKNENGTRPGWSRMFTRKQMAQSARESPGVVTKERGYPYNDSNPFNTPGTGWEVRYPGNIIHEKLSSFVYRRLAYLP